MQNYFTFAEVVSLEVFRELLTACQSIQSIIPLHVGPELATHFKKHQSRSVNVYFLPRHRTVINKRLILIGQLVTLLW